MKFRLSNGLPRFLRGLCVVSCLPLVFLLAYLSLPFVEPALSGAAKLSAELSFLSPGGEAAEAFAPAAPLADESEPAASQAAAGSPAPDTPAAPADASSSEAPPPRPEPPASFLPEANAPIAPTELGPLNLPTRPEGAGVITRKTYSPGQGAAYIPTGDGYIKNCTTISADTIRKTIAQPPNLNIRTNGDPMVLIMHTHTTEAYQDYSLDWFDPSYNSRTTDPQKNVCRVGDEIQKQLAAAGIGVIHDKTLHDYPSYNGSYERSAVTVKKYLAQYPSIQVVLDVHRDAIQPNPNTMIAPTTTINGRDCAQVMIISGCDDGTMNMPNYMENLKLSAALTRTMARDYPTLERPVLFDYRKYNQDLTTGSILLEVGGHANSLEEAVYCGELVGKSLAKTLLALAG